MIIENGTTMIDQELVNRKLGILGIAAADVEEIVLNDDGALSTIGTSAFRGFSGIQEVTIPQSVRNWGMGGNFRNCTSLTRVVVNGATIGSRAFAGCVDINQIEMPNVVCVGDYAFTGCSDEIIRYVELTRRRNLFGQLYDIEMNGNEWAEGWMNDYERAVNRFPLVEDWRNHEIQEELFYSDRNGIARLGMGGIPAAGLRPIGYDRLGDYLNEAVRTGREERAEIISRLGDIRRRLFALVNGDRPHIAFNRFVAGLMSDIVVPIPNMYDVQYLFNWLLQQSLVGQVDTNDDEFETWFKRACAIKTVLDQLLPGKTKYQIGVFAFSLCSNKNELDGEERQDRARELMRIAKGGVAENAEGMFRF